MTGDYLCRFYIKGRLTEEVIYASSPFQATRIIEAKYSGSNFRWSGPPNLAKNCIRWT